MRKLLYILLLILILPAQGSFGSKTTITFTMSDKSFPERSAWGESFRIARIEFIVDNRIVGSINTGFNSSTNTIIINNEFNLTKVNNISMIRVTGIHHEWGAFGDRENNVTREFGLGTTIFDGSGNSEGGTFSAFTTFPMVVNWHFTYKIEITPFQPVINSINGDWCYHDIVTFTLNQNNPFTTDSGLKYEWQYGFESVVWNPNSGFNRFLADVENGLSGLCTDGSGISCGTIRSAIYNTEYSFMNSYYSLYQNPTANGYSIAYQLLQGILRQNSSTLSYQDRDFLGSRFINVVLNQSSLPPPFDMNLVVLSWNPLGISSEADGLILFSPAGSKIQPSSAKTKIEFRARAIRNEKQGPFSSPVSIIIKPAAPTFNFKQMPSCINRATGSVEITGLSGVVPGAEYQYYIIKAGTPGGEPNSTYGPDLTVRNLDQGAYKIKIYYADPALTGCAVIQDMIVESNPDLKFNISADSASCPEKADGSISVKIISNYGAYKFKLNNTEITQPVGTFASLDNGNYTIEVTDQCYLVPRKETHIVKEPPAVTVSSVSKLDPTCSSVPNGKITVDASGGNNKFYYQIMNQGTVIASSGISEGPSWSYSTLPGGNYTVNVSSGGCSPAIAQAPALSAVMPVNFSAEPTAVDCFGKNTGSIKIIASGGNSSYNYSIDHQPFTTNSTFGSLYSGAYLVSVRSTVASCNDLKEGSVTIGSAPVIGISFTGIKNPACFEKNDGLIAASVSGGTGSYSYSWEQNYGGSWYPESGSSGQIENLYAGTYRVNIRDSKNCTQSMEAVLTQPSELVIGSVIPGDVACSGSNGSMVIVASGGTAGYDYSCFESSGPVFSSTSSTVTLPAGEYNVQVKDKNGCLAEYSDLVLITEPSGPLGFTFSSPVFNGFNISCAGSDNGTLMVEAAGGNGPKHDGSEYEGYTYSISGFPDQSQTTFSTLHAGSYIIKVKDGRGCSVQKTGILTEPEPLTLNLVSSSPVRCFGEPTGELIVSATGGIENTYKYSIDGSEVLSPGIFKNLNAYTYEIEVSDLNGCRKNLFASVESMYPPISIIASKKDVSCFGEGNGEINTAVTGGAGGFSFAWEKSSVEGWTALAGSDGERANLVPGIYRTKVTDSENCFQYGNAVIAEPSLLKITDIASSDIVCLGEKGSITIEVSGGTAGYKYYCSSENGEISESTNPVIQLPAGAYSASIKDVNGCIAVHSTKLQITQPVSPLDFTADLSSYHGYSVSCYGKSDGRLTVEASGGNGGLYSGYSYSIEDYAYQPDNSFSDLASGNYSVKVIDGRGCISRKNIVLIQPEAVSINLMGVSRVKCFGASTGEIKVQTSGGVPEYAYRLNGASGAASGIFKDLAALNYTIEVSDLNGCITELSTVIEHNNPPVSSLLASLSVRCYGESNGEITAELTGGSGGFTSSWEKKTNSGWQPYEGEGTHPVNLMAGLYRLKAVDSDNCPDTDSIEVKEPQPLRISNVRIKDAVCYGDKGLFEIEAAGGNNGYIFQYSPYNNSIVYQNYTPEDSLIAGIYRLRVADSKGCAYDDPGMFRITAPSAALSFGYELTEYGEYNVSCHGKQDGRISITATGGNDHGYSGYSYLLSGRAAQENSIFTSLEAGIYDLIVADGRGCSLKKPISLSQPESEITLSASSVKRPVCSYDNDGSVALTASGGLLPYVFSVNNGDYKESPEFTDLPVNTYLFRVRDKNGCAETYETVLLNVVSEMNLAGDITDVKCHGETSGEINIHVTGGAKPYSFSWNNNSLVNSLATNLVMGDYSVLVTDAAGCKYEKQFFVNQPEKPLSAIIISTPACVALKDGVINTNASGGTPPYSFAVDKSDFGLSSVFNVYSGNHKAFVKDYNNCLAEAQTFVNVKNIMPDVNFMLATSRYELDTLVVIDVSVPGPDEVTWEFSPEANVIDAGRNKALVKYNSAGLYPVKMTGLFGSCLYTIEKILNIAPFDPFAIPDSRNEDGIKSMKISPNPNDGSFELSIVLFTKQKVTVRIFDLGSVMLFSEILPADTEFFREINLPETVMPGSYVLRVTSENDSRSAVFVISR